MVPGIVEVFTHAAIDKENLGSLLLTSVYNTGGGAENICRSSIADRLIDTPKFIGRRSGGDGARNINQCLH